MVHFRIISIGKIKEAWIGSGLDHYKKLISKFASIEEIIIRGEKIIDESRKSAILEKEGRAIIAKLNPDNPLIVLDEHGENISSEKFSGLLEKYFKGGKNVVDFVIGSPLGLSDKVRAKADMLLSLSKMTFPHELARLILAEQLYRAMSILHGSRYHK